MFLSGEKEESRAEEGDGGKGDPQDSIIKVQNLLFMRMRGRTMKTYGHTIINPFASLSHLIDLTISSLLVFYLSSPLAFVAPQSTTSTIYFSLLYFFIKK